MKTSINLAAILLLIFALARNWCSISSAFILLFGDFTADTGNNNYILTPFKGNYLSYGVDFPGDIPSGHFSNGKLVPDILASMLGIKGTVPPFLQPNISDVELLTGVSFASAGSGYDELKTAISHVIPMSKQSELFKDYIRRIERFVGEKEARRIAANALVIVSAEPMTSFLTDLT